MKKQIEVCCWGFYVLCVFCPILFNNLQKLTYLSSSEIYVNSMVLEHDLVESNFLVFECSRKFDNRCRMHCFFTTETKKCSFADFIVFLCVFSSRCTFRIQGLSHIFVFSTRAFPSTILINIARFVFIFHQQQPPCTTTKGGGKMITVDMMTALSFQSTKTWFYRSLLFLFRQLTAKTSLL